MRVYNGARFIATSIRSVLAQRFSDFELLIIDDGSSDETAEIVRGFTDPRLRYIVKEHGGQARAANAALERAAGEYVAIMDADDVAHPQRLVQQVAVLEREPGIVVVGSWIDVIDHEGQWLGVRRYPTGDPAIRSTLLRFNPFAHSTELYRRETALAIGGYRTELETVEDYDFNARLLARGRGCNLPAQLVAYRLHAASVKSTRTKQQLRETILVRDTVRREYGYRLDGIGRCVDAAQRLSLHLPSSAVRRLFKRAMYGKRQASACWR